MKKLGKKIIIYLLVAAIVFAAAVIIITYFKDGTFAFNARYIANALPFMFLALGLLLVYDLLRIADGKTKSSKGGISQKSS